MILDDLVPLRNSGLGRLRTQILHAPVGGDNVGQILIVFFQFHEIRNVEEGVAFQANVDECRLHARQHPRDSTFMDTAGQRVFILPLVENLDYLIVLDHRHACFVAIRRDH